MAPHEGFKLAVIRTMRCDTCNQGNVNGLQECLTCNMHFCRDCIEGGRLDNDDKHRLQQDVIATLDWNKDGKSRRADHRCKAFPRQIAVSGDVPADRRVHKLQYRHAAPHDAIHPDAAPEPQGPGGMRFPQNVGAVQGNGFNARPPSHEQVDHGNFQYVSTPPGHHTGYSPSPPGYGPPQPAHTVPYAAPSSGPVQQGQYGAYPSQGGLAMPMGAMYGNYYPVNVGLPPHGDPRLNTPPGSHRTQSGFPGPNNFAGYHGPHDMNFRAALTPPNFAGLAFNQLPPQPQPQPQHQPVYNNGGYVPHGGMTTGQFVMGPGHHPGQLYSGGPFPPQALPREQLPPRGQEIERQHIPYHVEPAQEVQDGEPESQGHAEKPADPLAIQRQEQQQAWEREQAQQKWEQQQAREAWERQQAQQALQTLQVQQPQQPQQTQQPQQPQKAQQTLQPLQQRRTEEKARGEFEQMWEQAKQQRMQHQVHLAVQQEQSWEVEERKDQPAVEQASRIAQEAQKKDEQAQERGEQSQLKHHAVRPSSEDGGAVSGLTPIAAPTFPLAHIIAPHETSPQGSAPQDTTPPNALPPITSSPAIPSSGQGNQTRVSTSYPQPSAPEPDDTNLPCRLQAIQTEIVPTVVDHVQRPFGIPALARDLYRGKPNHYDETEARWREAEQERAKQIWEYDEDDDNATELDAVAPAGPNAPSGDQGSQDQERGRAKRIREYDENDYDDSDDKTDDDATETDIGAPARPNTPTGDQLPRGHKRGNSELSLSSVDSTLTAELEQVALDPQTHTDWQYRQGPQPSAAARPQSPMASRDAQLDALQMVAAANTLHGGGHGLIGSRGEICVAKDKEIMRRQEELGRESHQRKKNSRAVKPEKKKQRRDGGVGGEGDD